MPLNASRRPLTGSRRADVLVALLLAVALGERPAPAQSADPVKAPTRPAARAVPEGLNFANGLFRQRRYDLAADEYERFLKSAPAGPDAVEARYGLANARLFQGRYPEARRQFETFLEQAPDHPNAPSAQFRVGETAYLMSDLPAAREAFERYTRAHPDGRHLDTAWPCLGDVYFRLGDLEKARTAYETAVGTHPKGRLADRARFGLGRSLAGLGRTDEALRVLTDLAVAGGPDWADKARHEAGRTLMAAGRHEQAVAMFEALEKASPRSPLVGEARLERAEALGKLGRRQEGEDLLRPLAEDPGQPLAARAAHALGASLRERGKPRDALAVLDAALKRFGDTPTAPALWFGSAESAQALGEADDAIERFGKAAATDSPWADDALYRAAGLALEARDRDRAARLAGELTERFPNSPLRADARVIQARAALLSGEPKTAIGLLERTLADDKPGPRTAQAARYYLSQAYRENGEPERADAVVAALEKAPATTDALFLVGQGHVEAGRFREAIGPLEKYLADSPDGDVADYALSHLAHARLETGEPDRAAAALDLLETRFPQSAALPSTRLRLAEAALAAKQPARAAALFRLASEAPDPRLAARARAGLGWSLLQDKRPGDAARAFAAVIEADPDGPLAAEAALGRARALEADGQADAALEAYKQLAERYPNDDRTAPAAIGQARLLAAGGQPAQAAEAFARYLEQHPDGGGEPVDALLAEQAWALVDAGQAERADATFRALLERFPDSPRAVDARLKLAESAAGAGKPEEVETLLGPVVEPGSKAGPVAVQSALYRLGRSRADRKDWNGAAQVLDRLIADHPDCAFRREARLWRAEVAFQAGDARTAEAGFAALAEEPPAESDPPGLAAAAGQRRVRSLVLLERWKDAVAAADAWKAAHPGDPMTAEVDYARGRGLQGLARFDEARAAYQAVIEAVPGSEQAALAQFMCGETYFHQKNYNEALRAYLMVDVLYDVPAWQAMALLQAGKVHEQLAQWAEAAETYERLQSDKRLQSEFPEDARAEAGRRLAEARRRAGQGLPRTAEADGR